MQLRRSNIQVKKSDLKWMTKKIDNIVVKKDR